MTTLLEVRDLAVSYGHVEAVRGVSFALRAGEIAALLGPNGAGKSSTLGAIAGLLKPVRGSVKLEARELAGQPAHALVSAGIVLVPEGRGVLQTMSVAENLQLGADVRPWDSRAAQDAAVAEELKRFPSLERRLRQPAGALSGGEQQMLAIARALLSRPRILLLDEPSMGLAPQLVKQVFDAIRSIRRPDTAILLVEQNARMALQVAQHAYVLENGRIVLEGAAEALAKDPRLEAAYLGGHV